MKKIKTWITIISFICIMLSLSGCRALIKDIITINKQPSTQYCERKLKIAVQFDNLEMAKEALEEGANINKFETTYSMNGQKRETNPLWVAIDRGAFDTAEYLIKCGADLNSYKDTDGGTFLTNFSAHKYSVSKRFIPLLLEHGADPTLTNSKGYTPIEKMLLLSDVPERYMREFIDLMVKNGAVIDKNTVKAAYNYAGCEMLPKMIEKLIEDGKETGLSLFEENIILEKSTDVLMKITKKELKKYDEEAILKLITSYCDTKVLDKCLNSIDKDYNLDILLIIACRAGNLENVKYLIELGANINLTDRERTALVWAIINNHHDVAEYLLINGANFNLDNMLAEEGVTNELCCAAMNGNVEMLKLLLDYLGKPEDTDVSSAIQTAANFEHEEVINYFFDIGYSGEIIDNNTLSVLQTTIKYRNKNVVQLLIDHGADINGKLVKGIDRRGTILENAISSGDVETVKCLLENGAKPYINPLITAIRKGNLEIVKLLVEYGADLSETSDISFTALHYAAEYSNNILRYLVENGADINYLEADKDTSALIIAVNYGMVDNAKYLIEAGADTSIRNSSGKTAYEFAQQAGYKPMIEMFEEMNVTQ